MPQQKTDTEGAVEREPNPQEVLAEILKKHEQARSDAKEGGPEWLEERLQGIPEAAKDEIRAYEKELADAGVAPENRTKFIEREAVRFEQTYVERRFKVGENETILKEEFSKEKAIEWIKNLLDKKPTPEDLAKVARLSFDANGLKAVNDLSGSHEKGTEYLKRIADVIYDKDSPVRKRLMELGVKDILPVTGSGDEYSILINGDRAFTPAELSEITAMYSEAIEALEVGDLVDFSDPETQLRYLGISEKEFAGMDEAGKAATLRKAKEGMPESFTMRASASGGAATLLDGMRAAMRDPRAGKRLTAEDSYDKALSKMMGGLWDASDRSAMENKTVYKEALRAPDATPEEKFYSRVLARTTEARVIEQKLDDMAKEAGRKNAMVREMQALAGVEDMDPATLKAAMMAIIERAKA